MLSTIVWKRSEKKKDLRKILTKGEPSSEKPRHRLALCVTSPGVQEKPEAMCPKMKGGEGERVDQGGKK